MRIDVAWQRWDNWCRRTAEARWLPHNPNAGRQVVVDLEKALRAGEAKLGVPPGTLRAQIEVERRGGRSAPDAVATVVGRHRERLRAGGGPSPSAPDVAGR